jgi:dephospho-CoA kinase
VTLVVGLTGNVAAGKSSVAALLRERGATIIDADVLARRAVEPGSNALGAIATRWPTAMRPDGTLDRGALRNIVFRNPDDQQALNAIVHPVVARLRDAELGAAMDRGDPIVVYDVPLLFEAGLEDTVDVIVLVDAPEPVRRGRLLRDRALRPAEADALIAAQLPALEKRARADYIVENDAGRDALAARVAALWDALARRATDR